MYSKKNKSPQQERAGPGKKLMRPKQVSKRQRKGSRKKRDWSGSIMQAVVFFSVIHVATEGFEQERTRTLEDCFFLENRLTQIKMKARKLILWYGL